MSDHPNIESNRMFSDRMRRRATDWVEDWRGRNVGERLCDLILHSDTTPTRFGLAVAALFWTIGLLVPGDTMTRPVYRFMGEVLPEIGWTVLWGTYAALMFWRVFTITEGKSLWPFIVNAFGLW